MESEIKDYTSVFLDVTGSWTLLRYGINKILGKFDLYCILKALYKVITPWQLDRNYYSTAVYNTVD